MDKEYASVLNRVKAALIDSIVLVAMMFLFSEILSFFEGAPSFVRMIIFIFIFVLYDPIFTSAFGATIGHQRIGITVRNEENHEKNLGFFSALFRFVFKALLGWISLITITSNEKRKAIHDYIGNSIVLQDVD